MFLDRGNQVQKHAEGKEEKMSRESLYELLSTASVSGFEEDIQRKVIKYADGFADEIYTD